MDLQCDRKNNTLKDILQPIEGAGLLQRYEVKALDMWCIPLTFQIPN